MLSSLQHGRLAVVLVQAELQRKHELLAQLDEQYGRISTSSDSGVRQNAAEQKPGDVHIKVLEGRNLRAVRGASSTLQFRRNRTCVKVWMHGGSNRVVSRATTWRAGGEPVWHDELVFEGRERTDIATLQVCRSSDSGCQLCSPATSGECCNMLRDRLSTRGGVQVLELRRFGADAVLAEASLPLSSMPCDGRPKYTWLTLRAHGSAAQDPAEPNLAEVHLRLQWTPHTHRGAYRAISVSLQGIGVSAIDSLSAHVLRELIYFRAGDIQVGDCCLHRGGCS